MNKIKILGFIAFLLFTGSCNSDGGLVVNEAIISHIEIKNSRLNFVSDFEKVDIDKIFIDKELTHSIGGDFSGFYEIGDNMLLIDRGASEISCISREGKLLWIPIPPSPEIDRYTVIGSVDIDSENNNIYIEDRLNKKIDVFSFGGDYVMSIESENPFMGFVVKDRSDYIFDISEIQQSGSGEDEYVPSRFLHLHKGIKEMKVPMVEAVNYDAIPTNNYNRFNKVNGVLYHRMPYENVLYSVNDNVTVAPELSFSFSQGFEFVDLSRNTAVNYVWGELDKKGLPDPYLIVYDRNYRKVYSTFRQAGSMYFTCFEDQRQLFDPSKFLRVDGTIFKIPYYYHNGKFYQQMYAYEYDYLQHVDFNSMSITEIEEGLNDLKEVKGDDDDVIIIVYDFS